VGCQRREAPTQLNLRPLPGWEGSLPRFSRSDIDWCRIGIAHIRILLNLDEGSVLCSIVIFQAGGMFKEVGLKGFTPALLLVFG
jgi:hypothetical protein